MIDPKQYSKPWFSPKIWMGCNIVDWLKILWEARFKIGLASLHSFVFITISSIIRLLLSWLERLIYHRRLSQTEISRAPVFVIGHWRSGTTLLHELVARDKQFSYADTYQCFSPNTFLFPGPILRGIVGFFLPDTRPMDSMPMGTSKPQEDEFALCILGAPSPYRGIMFPTLLGEYGRYLRISNLPPSQQAHWKKTLLNFLTKLSMRSDKRIVLKSPTHSFRIKLLSEMFPDARFVYIRRDPYTVYKSTLHLWMTLLNQQGLHKVDPNIVESHVRETYTELLDAVEKDRASISSNRFCEISYEELVAAPTRTMEHVYESVELDGFECVRNQLEAFERENRGYKTNKFDLKADEIIELNRLWGPYITRQGYELR